VVDEHQPRAEAARESFGHIALIATAFLVEETLLDLMRPLVSGAFFFMRSGEL
jgi:hypothetical protein